MRLSIGTFLATVALAGTVSAQPESVPLLRQPTVSATHVVFVHGDDLWIVGRGGGRARRLTTHVGEESDPVFSPDGSRVAFTANYDGNMDVYVVAAAGGEPNRLTYHPGLDQAVTWTGDGQQVVFRSRRDSYSRFDRLHSISVDGGMSAPIPLPLAVQGSFSPDGSQMAYVPLSGAFQVWKRYRGGRASPVWIANLSDSSIEKVPREDSNDFNPMWVGREVFFLSDRNGPITLFAYNAESKQVRQVITNQGLDIKSASAAGDAIVYEQFGTLHLHDIASRQTRALEIQVAGDLPSVRPRFEKVADNIATARLSPTGARAVFEARGEILTVPAEKGDVRNLTGTSGAADRDPSWSPDGRWIAYFSDDTGEYTLCLAEQSGLGEKRSIPLGTSPSFYYSPTWSPDGKKIAYTDKRLKLWIVDVETEECVEVDENTYDSPFHTVDPAWSPDSRWLAYTKQLRNHLHAVFLHSVDTGKTIQVSDGMSDARYAAFDKDGKYLYFTASTDAAPTTGWLDMSSVNRPVSRNVYLIVLNKNDVSPLAPESDEEKPETEDPTEKGEQTDVTVTVDADGIDQRILALPIPAKNYLGLRVGKAGVVFLLEAPPVIMGPITLTVHQFKLEDRKVELFLDGVRDFEISANGEKVLYLMGKQWAITGADAKPEPGKGALALDKMVVHVDPRAEWEQMYQEVWRIQRDFLYDPGAHGLDLEMAEEQYGAFVQRLSSRSDLNYLFREMLGNLVLGHVYVGGGDGPDVEEVPGGLLGADYEVANNRYRFARIYTGENWNPELRAPLTQPGAQVEVGEYLFTVNGRDVYPPQNLYSFFENTAGKSVVLKVGSDPAGAGSREVTVVPVEDEDALRNRAWIEDNRRKVEQMSDGRLGYVYLPNTAGAGYTNFNRYYFAQIGKEGIVVDERFNGGGMAADYIVDFLRRPLMNYWSTREGEDFPTPQGSIFGPKVMIINEFAGSGGDALPWYFRKAGVGKLVGMRTWGGLVGIYDYPPLIDGGFVTAPRLAFWNPDGTWDVENNGVAPDIEVELDPKVWREGRDPQLEKAVEVALEELRQNPIPRHQKPAFPDYHKKANQ